MLKYRKGILVISTSFSPDTGGVQTHLTDLTECMSKIGLNIFVLTYMPILSNDKAPSIEKGNNLEIYRFRSVNPRFLKKIHHKPALEFLFVTPHLFVRSLLFTIKHEKRIHVIHSHDVYSSFIGMILSKLFKKRFIISVHNPYGCSLYDNLITRGSIQSKFLSIIFNFADTILTLSNQSKIQLIDLGCHESKIKVFRYWVDQKKFMPRNIDAKQICGIENRFTVLFVGTLDMIKGPDMLLKIAEQVQDINFMFIGNGKLSAIFEKASKCLINVKYLGQIENEKLPIYYNAADLFVIPSRYQEGFGRVIIEALSSGLPVIGSNRGGIPEAISEDVGIIVEPNIVELKNAIQLLYDNKKLYEKLKQNCRNYALRNFGVKNHKTIKNSYYE